MKDQEMKKNQCRDRVRALALTPEKVYRQLSPIVDELDSSELGVPQQVGRIVRLAAPERDDRSLTMASQSRTVFPPAGTTPNHGPPVFRA